MADLSAVKAIFFDLDDTLCAYWDASKASLRATFEQHLLPGITTDEMFDAWAKVFRKFSKELKNDAPQYMTYLETGEPTRTKQMAMTLESLGIEDATLAAKLSESYMVIRDKTLTLFPEALPVLDALKGKFKLGLITNGPADIQRQEVVTLKLESYFEPILIEGEMHVGKPEQEVFERAAQLIGLTAPELLMVGNSYSHDIRPAIEAGWHAAWIRRPSDVPPSARGTSDGPETLPVDAPSPELTISNLSELLDHLKPSS